MSFGKNLRNARIERGLTQAELAELIGIAQPTLAQYENDAKAPNVNLAGTIAEVLGLTVDDLLNG